MKKLQKNFTRSGFVHKQIKRIGAVAIYKRRLASTDRYHFEVVKISKHNGYNMGSAYIKSAETYPGASLWGIQGWTYSTLESAETRFKKACKRFNKSLVIA